MENTYNMYDTIDCLARNWNNLSEEDKKEINTKLAGTRKAPEFELIPKDVITIKLNAEIDNIDGIKKQINDLQEKLGNMKINLTILDDVEEVGGKDKKTFLSNEEMVQIYNSFIIDEDKINSKLEDILCSLQKTVQLGNDTVYFERSHLGSKQEKDYIETKLSLLGYGFGEGGDYCWVYVN